MGMPVYNGANYLVKALDSLLSQSFTDFEIVIVDNASTDATELICKDYLGRDSRIKYFRNPSNVGAALNYQIALEKTSGEYFKWAAHDDVYDAGWLKRCVDILDSNPNVILAYTRTVFIDANDIEISRFNDPFRILEDKPYWRFRQMVVKLRWCHAIFGLMRRELPAGLKPIGNYIGSDMVYLAELALHGKFIEDESYGFHRRMHNNSSQQANRNVENLQEWYDPRTKGKLYLRHWRFLKEYALCVSRAPVSVTQKLRCWAFLLRVANWNRDKLAQEASWALGASRSDNRIQTSQPGVNPETL